MVQGVALHVVSRKRPSLRRRPPVEGVAVDDPPVVPSLTSMLSALVGDGVVEQLVAVRVGRCRRCGCPSWSWRCDVEAFAVGLVRQAGVVMASPVTTLSLENVRRWMPSCRCGAPRARRGWRGGSVEDDALKRSADRDAQYPPAGCCGEVEGRMGALVLLWPLSMMVLGCS